MPENCQTSMNDCYELECSRVGVKEFPILSLFAFHTFVFVVGTCTKRTLNVHTYVHV